MVYKIFVDTNVYLDAILERTAEWGNAELIMKMAALRHVQLYTSANNLVNTIYALRKQKLTSVQIIDIIALLLSYTELMHTSNEAFSLALKSGFSDLEDAVQYYTALDSGNINYFITSNIKDYTKALPQLPVVSLKEFVALVKK